MPKPASNAKPPSSTTKKAGVKIVPIVATMRRESAKIVNGIVRVVRGMSVRSVGMGWLVKGGSASVLRDLYSIIRKRNVNSLSVRMVVTLMGACVFLVGRIVISVIKFTVFSARGLLFWGIKGAVVNYAKPGLSMKTGSANLAKKTASAATTATHARNANLPSNSQMKRSAPLASVDPIFPPEFAKFASIIAKNAAPTLATNAFQPLSDLNVNVLQAPVSSMGSANVLKVPLEIKINAHHALKTA